MEIMEFFYFIFNASTDFEKGVVATIVVLIASAFALAIFIKAFIWFDEVNDMREEYIEKRNKKISKKS